jgi:hypothetical protein
MTGGAALRDAARCRRAPKHFRAAPDVLQSHAAIGRVVPTMG